MLTSAWEDIVETAVNPAAIFSEVMRGLARMKLSIEANETKEKYIPSAAKFLRERKFLELWKLKDGRPAAKPAKLCQCGGELIECVGSECDATLCTQCTSLGGNWHLGNDPLCGKCLESTNKAIEKNKQILQEMG